MAFGARHAYGLVNTQTQVIPSMNRAPGNNPNNITASVPSQKTASIKAQLDEAVDHHRAGRLFEDSPLCDGPAYARNVEDAFRAMWDARGGGKDRTP